MKQIRKPILLAVAPNGAYKTYKDHPKIPLTIDELALDAKACLDAGASMIHLHVRDSDLKHSLSVDLYRQAIAKIKQITADKMFIQVTSESGGVYKADEQLQMIEDLKPDAVSISIREIKSLDNNEINKFFNKLHKLNIWPQIILYNEYDMNLYFDYLDKDVLSGTAYPVLLVIGKPQPEGQFDLDILIKPESDKFKSTMVCAFGMEEQMAAIIAAHNGIQVRIGFENNLQLLDGSVANDNAELIAQTATSLFLAKRELGDIDYARKIMQPDW